MDTQGQLLDSIAYNQLSGMHIKPAKESKGMLTGLMGTWGASDSSQPQMYSVVLTFHDYLSHAKAWTHKLATTEALMLLVQLMEGRSRVAGYQVPINCVEGIDGSIVTQAIRSRSHELDDNCEAANRRRRAEMKIVTHY